MNFGLFADVINVLNSSCFRDWDTINDVLFISLFYFIKNL